MEEINLRLNCEKWTKYKNLMNKKGELTCPECIKQHTINFEKTLNTPINQEKINRKKIEISLQNFNLISDIEINEHFDNIKCKIYQHTLEFIKNIKDMRIEMFEKIEQKKTENCESIKNLEFEKLNLKNHTKEIDKINDLLEKIEKEIDYMRKIEQMESEKNKILKELKNNQFIIKEMTDRIENLIGNLKLTINNLPKLKIGSLNDRNVVETLNFENKKCINTLNGHANYAFCLQLIDQFTLASGSGDSTIKIWDLRNYKCIKTINGHTSWVLCLQLIDRYTLASGSSDSTIKIWDLRNYQCIDTLNCHENSVLCLQLIDQFTLASGSGNPPFSAHSHYGDKTIRIWDLN